MLKFKEKIRVLLDIIMNGKEINSTDSETECTSVEDPLNMQRTASNEKNPISVVSNMINEGNIIEAPGQGRISI